VDSIVIAAFLGAWFLISIPCQLTNKFGRSIKRRDTYALIPAWTFFAPRPGISDYTFVFRDFGSTGPGEWQEVQWCPKRNWLNSLWHPTRYRKKVIIDCINSLVLTLHEMREQRLDDEMSSSSLMLSVPYLALLNIVMKMPKPEIGIFGRQFAIVEQVPSNLNMPPKLLLQSIVHKF
jgi:hypothetical protein